MADSTITVEARLKNYISKNIDTITRDVKRFGENGGKGFQKAATEANKFNEVMKRSGTQVKKASTETSKFNKVMKESGSQVKSFLMRFGPAAAIIGLATAGMMKFGRAITFVVDRTIEFQFTMSKAMAILVPTREEFDRLSRKARELGGSTVFTASQAGAAFVEMGKLGMKANEIIAASAGVLDLAAAAQTGMADAAKTAGATLKQFGLDASESTRIADVMTRSFSMSALDMDKFRESMKMAGPVMGNLGLSIEETTGMLSVLADRGIDGSLAGTALRRVMLELADSTSKANRFLDNAGENSEDLIEKFEGLRRAGMDVTVATELFGLRGTTAAQIIAAQTDEVNRLTTAYENAEGAASKMAATMLDNVRGATIKLKSAQEGLALAVGDVWAPGKQLIIEAQTERMREQTKAVEEGIVPLESTLNIWQKIHLAWIRGGTQAVKNKRDQQAALEELRKQSGRGRDRLSLGEEVAVEKEVDVFFGDDEKVERTALSVDKLRAAMARQAKAQEGLAAAEAAAAKAKGGDDAEKIRKFNEKFAAEELKMYREQTKVMIEEQRKRDAGMHANVEQIVQRNAPIIEQAEKRAELEKSLAIEIEDAKIANIRNAADREVAELRLQQARQLEVYEAYGVDVTALMQEQAKARDTMRVAAEKATNKKITDAVVAGLDSLISATSNAKGELKGLYIALAIMRAGVATVTGVQVAWDGAAEIGGVPGAVYGIAMSAVTVAENAAMLAGSISAIQNAATGMDQVVGRETLVRAGEAGPERITIRPASTDMESRASGGGGSSIVFNPQITVYGGLDRAAAQSVIETEERLARQLVDMRNDGF